MEGGGGSRGPLGGEEILLEGSGEGISCRLWKAPDPGAWLLLVHGLGDHSGRYAEVAGALNDAGITVVAPDLPGHGRSSGWRGDAPSVAHLLDVLDRARERGRMEAPDEPAFLMGHSMGGLLAIRYLQTRPDHGFRAVVLSAPWLATLRPVPGWKLLLARVLRVVAPALPVSTGPMAPEELTRDPERQERFRRDPLVHHRMSPRLFASVSRAQRDALDASLNVPALVVVPGSDPLVDSGVTRAWAEQQPLAELRERPEDRHEPWNELDREDLLLQLPAWLQERGRTRR